LTFIKNENCHSVKGGGTFTPILVSLSLFVFELEARTKTEEQTDEQKP